ncbi:hypothetical protein AB0F03_37825, partial [Streptomyces sp. NPDC028722]|uniref:hypothetical protein n=1 Tax=Streptomyces sp. NPDC028722 TaxID=3155016 RepID=UPI0033ECD65A
SGTRSADTHQILPTQHTTAKPHNELHSETISNKVTLAHGVDAAKNLSKLLGLWEQAVPLLTCDTESEDRVPCPPVALVALLDMALGWVRLGLGVAPRGQTPSSEQMQWGVEGGRRILASLHPLLQNSPGAAMRAHRELARIRDRAQTAGQKLPTFDVDSDLQSFCEWGSVESPMTTRQPPSKCSLKRRHSRRS